MSAEGSATPPPAGADAAPDTPPAGTEGATASPPAKAESAPVAARANSSGAVKRPTKAVAVFGVSGTVGRDLVAQLDIDPEIESILAIDDQPIPDRLPSKAKPLEVKPGESLEGWWKTAGVKLAVYLDPVACATSEKAIGADDIESFRRFTEACVAAQVEGVVVASGASIYGARKENPPFFTEGSPLRPGGLPPGEADLAREKLCVEMSRKLPQAALAVCRLAPVVGFGTKGIVSASLESPKFNVLEGFDPPVQYVHVEDVTRAIFRLLKGRKTGVYNLAPDDYTTLMQVGRAFKKPLARVSPRMASWKAWFGSLVGGVPATWLPLLQFPILLSNRKIKRDLGYTFKYGSEQALVQHAKLAALKE